MSVADNGIQVEPGFHTTLTVIPTKISSTEKFKKLPLETRSCKYRNEIDDNIEMLK